MFNEEITPTSLTHLFIYFCPSIILIMPRISVKLQNQVGLVLFPKPVFRQERT
jgi:hypothetical protein